ncbi:hypothetical protein TNCV_2466341 [Trichonephila clavipes]|nr:hypothetical protein TNCV_2466341 [Trichonephila clavipes]
MIPSSSFVNPTPLTQADTSRDVLPREERSLAGQVDRANLAPLTAFADLPVTFSSFSLYFLVGLLSNPLQFLIGRNVSAHGILTTIGSFRAKYRLGTTISPPHVDII